MNMWHRDAASEQPFVAARQNAATTATHARRAVFDAAWLIGIEAVAAR